MSRPARSAFAVALIDLLDAAAFGRAEWARLLGVTPSAISQWVTDRTVPRPDLLNLIFEMQRNAEGVPREVVSRFEVMARRPAREVSPLGSRLGESVWEYMKRPAAVGFVAELRRMSLDQQIQALAGGVGADHEDAAAELPAEVPQSEVVWCDSAPKHPDFYLEPAFAPIQGEGMRLDLQAIAGLTDSPVVIVGAPGSGKSAAFGRLAQLFLSRRGSPVAYVQATTLFRDWVETRAFEALRPVLDRPSSADVIVDGFDEIEVPERDRALSMARELASIPWRQLVMGSRETAHAKQLPAKVSFRLLPFTQIQAQTCLHSELMREPRLRDKDLTLYMSHWSEAPAFGEVFRTPLLVSVAIEEFVRHALTPFSATVVLERCIRFLMDDWDRRKGVIRLRDPWFAPERVMNGMGQVAYSLLKSSRDSFTASDLTSWIPATPSAIQARQCVDLVSETTGLFRQIASGRWQLSHASIGDYLAARHVVESAVDARELLAGYRQNRRLRRAYAIACALSPDATPLLRSVLDDLGRGGHEDVAFLGSIVAQPLTAEPDVISEVCDRVVESIEELTSHWTELPAEMNGSDRRSALWRLRIAGPKRADSKATTLGPTMRTVHKARSGPANEPYRARLRASRSPIVRKFEEALSIDGRFEDRLGLEGTKPVVVTEILEAAV